MQWMEVICDFIEKVRNLFQWEDPNMTFIFLLLLIVLFIFVTFLPLRFIIFLALFHKFYKGRNWQKRRTINNEEVCKIEMQNFFAENKITCITDYNETWVNLVKKIKDSDFNKVPKMDKRLTQYFHLTVKIYLPKNILIDCETP